MGPLASQLTGGGRFCSRLANKRQCSSWSAHWAPSFNNRCSAAMATPSSSEAAGETWSHACSRTPWWRCPLCSASYGISPFCTAFPHLQPYFFFKHPRRRCPALGSRCDNESSAKEPVRAP